jgi:hypothetical protein
MSWTFTYMYPALRFASSTRFVEARPLSGKEIPEVFFWLVEE